MGLAYIGHHNIYIIDTSHEDASISFNLGYDMGNAGINEYFKQNGILRIDRGNAYMVVVFERAEDVTNFKLKYEKITSVRP